MTPVELLSPAKNLEYGKAAIIHGADAVYIGAPRFGARAEASNPVTDIEKLVRFAHLYRAKVYATFNTILFDHEMDDALRMIGQLYETGIDALIIQDMGLLQHGLPPIPLFASTQMHNHVPERMIFLEKAGFQRVILARELSFPEIMAIRRQTNIELEYFVHGALCVSYSGQCYMSQVLTGRSGNRGVCAQPCRASCRLVDADGHTIIKNAHLLSLKDLNLSSHLTGLLHAGITSFKIEGRLKDLTYVKNITAFYRQRLDAILENDGSWGKSSSGTVDFHFIPDPHKTFNRGYTAYFIDGRKEKVASPQTRKSTGQRLGTVVRSHPQWFTVNTQVPVNSGDGLCWLHPQRGAEGVLVNRTEGNKIFPAKPVRIKPGTEIYRNRDFLFEKQLAGISADRRIAVSFELRDHEAGYTLCVRDEDGNSAEYSVDAQKLPAKDIAASRKQIDAQLRRLGNAPFIAGTIAIPDAFAFFIPAAGLNDMRRQAIRCLEECRTGQYRSKVVKRLPSDAKYPARELDYRGNIANRHARDFYRQCGVERMEDAFELQADYREKVLMVAKYCIKYQYDMCPRWQHPAQHWKEPLFIRDNRSVYRLEFDCNACEMKVILA